MLLSLLFKTLRAHKLAIPENVDEWPANWKTPEYKTYPRCVSVALPQPTLSLGSLDHVLGERHSTRVFDASKSLTLKEIATLYHFTCGIRSMLTESRFHPSGGGRYPLEGYLVAYRIEELEPGIYHYAARTHTLEKIADATVAEKFRAEGLRYAWSQDAAGFFALGAIWDRSTRKYGEFGYDLIAVEAGHITQNLTLIATALGIPHCTLFGFNVPVVDPLFDFADEESITYITALGK